MRSIASNTLTGVKDLIERLKAWLETRIGDFKGKPSKKAEVRQGTQDAPTRRYQIVRVGEPEPPIESYLITDSKEIPLQPGFLVGRGGSCHLKLTDPGTSRVHASFSLVGKRWLLRDNSSKNGTLVNGEPVRSALLKSGDRIQIGQTVLVYEER